MTWAQDHRTFRSELASVSLAREFVRGVLRDRSAVTADLESDVVLAVSELATNDVRHGSDDPFTVDIGHDAHEVTMSVTSTLGAGRAMNPAEWGSNPRHSDGGRGIGIVRAVTSDFAYQVNGDSVSAACRFGIHGRR